MAKKSKRYQGAKEKVDVSKDYSVSEAINVLKSVPGASFDETVELAVLLGINPKNSDQQIRTSIGLPHGTGKSVRVAVFAEGDDAVAAEEAGADIVGSDDLVEKVSDGWLEFDVAIATPPMMRKIGALGRFLGPRGLMPNPKNGTLTPDVSSAVEEFKAGKVEVRNDSGANVHLPVGKLSFPTDHLEENVRAVIQSLQGMRPPGIGHNFFKKVFVTTTMGPSVQLSV